MMKQEFENMIESELSEQSWITIQHVYQWHPRFEYDGKTKAAELWKLFGNSIFKEMLPIADLAMELRQKVENLRSALEGAKIDLQEFADNWK